MGRQHFNAGDSFGGSHSQLRDFVNVDLNRHGRTNLLRDIRRPLGATIALDYVRAGNTPEHPQRRWVLASRTGGLLRAASGNDSAIGWGWRHHRKWLRKEVDKGRIERPTITAAM